MIRSHTPGLLGALAVIASALLLLAPVYGESPTALVRGSGAVVLGIGLLATRVLPEHLTTIIFYFVCLVFAVAPPEVVFSGFHSGAVWLVFGGLVMGTAAERSGLGDRIAGLTLRFLPASYAGILTALALIALLLGFLIPSGIGRIALLVPFTAGLARQLGFEPGSRGFTGLVLGTGMATIMPTNAILPANLPALVMAGAAESIYDVHVSYLGYLALNLPVLGMFSLVLIVVINVILFGETPRAQVVGGAASPWSKEQRRLMAVLVAAVALWITDYAHGVAPAWVALGAAVICLLPRVGVLAPNDMVQGINLAPWFFVAGVVGLGAVVTHTGLGDELGRAILARVDLVPGENARSFAALVATGVAVGVVTTIGAMPGIMTSLAQTLAAPAGWSVESALMTQVPGFIFFLLPYQVPPIVLMLALANLALGRAVQVLVLHFALGMLLALPLHYHWARALGYMQ